VDGKTIEQIGTFKPSAVKHLLGTMEVWQRNFMDSSPGFLGCDAV